MGQPTPQTIQLFKNFPPAYATLIADYLKHVTNLSTGAVVLQIAFLERVFPHPKWKAVIVISLASFGVSIIAATFSQAMVISLSGENPHLYEAGLKVATLGMRTMIVSWIGFLAGVIATMVFVLKNLFSIT